LTFRDDQAVLSVAAPPVDGAATEEARRALANALGVAPSRVSLERGASSRTKVFSVDGIRIEAARAALALASGASSRGDASTSDP
jgi:uncharacterized protein YggU (UPF0235/DUF167 family)